MRRICVFCGSRPGDCLSCFWFCLSSCFCSFCSSLGNRSAISRSRLTACSWRGTASAALRSRNDAAAPAVRQKELDRLLAAIPLAKSQGLGVNLGHGLDYDNIYAFKDTPGVSEYSIGHSIVARAVLTGMVEAVSTMCAIIDGFPD